MTNSHTSTTQDKQSKITRGSPYEYLQSLSNQSIAANIVVHDSSDNSVAWTLHVESNHLCYATSSIQVAERLFCLLREYRPDLAARYWQSSSDLQWQNGFDEYEYLCDLLGRAEITLSDLNQILPYLAQEALMNVLAIKNTRIDFHCSFPLKGPIFWTAPLPKLMQQVRDSVIQWQCLRPYFCSPFTRLYLSPNQVNFFFNFWQRNHYNSDPNSLVTFEQMPGFVSLLNEQISLYQAALRLQTQPVILARWLLPFIKSGALTTLDYNKLKNPEQPLVACIDDSIAVQTQVEMVLHMGGYQVLGITQPKHALNTLRFNNKRARLIIMDINMPEQNGFQLCDQLRQSGYLRDIPIIMLTGRDGIIDKVLARMKGIKAFMTKPLDSVKLLSSVQQLISA